MMMLTIPVFLMLFFLGSKNKFSWYFMPTALLWLSFLTLNLVPQTTPIFLSPQFTTDLLSATMILLTLLITALMIIASQAYIINSFKPYQFMAVTLALCIILIMAYMTSHFINFYIFFEASLIPTLILILAWGYQPERLQAGTYLMMYMIFTSLPLLFSLLYINKLSGHLFIHLPLWNTPKSFILVWWLLTILPFLVKTPMYSMHLWLPKAHVEAPVAGSMILAGILLKLGTYGLFRLYFNFFSTSFMLSSILIVISLWGACIASLLCLRQTDMKALIAYSSVSHMGLATAGVMSMNTWGWSSSLMLMIAHGLISSALFAGANMFYETSHSRNLTMIKGMMNIFPMMTMWWFLLNAANLGAPPSINMLAETMLITATIAHASTTAILILPMIMATTGYCLLLYSSTQYGPINTYINTWTMTSSRHYSIFALHLIPAILFFLKPEAITLWF